jgi:replicative DNA helicase
MNAANDLAEFPCMIADKPGRTVGQIAAVSRVWKRRKNIGVVFIDYLQLISPDDRRAQREQQVGDISRGIAAMAKELHLPVVLLAQMNREIEKRPTKDRTPRLSDLRESGAIEQDAFTIIALDNPSQYDPSASPTVIKAYVLKNRDGERGVIDLTWNPETVTFTDQGHFSPVASGFFSSDAYATQFGSDEQPPQYEANYGR